MNFLGRRKAQWALIGAFLSFIGPLGEWAFLRYFSSTFEDPLLITYLYTEFITLVLFSLFGYMMGSYTGKIEFLALRDNLTSLYNRHYLIEHLSQLLAIHRRHKTKISLIMLDLDYFKRVNDSHGHVVGDQVLKAVAKCIGNHCREADVLARYGGEEFIVVCQDTDIQECFNLAERIRGGIGQLKPDELGFPGPQTISAGVYELPADEAPSVEQLINRADQALYQAKQSGRNKVVVSTPAY